MLGNGDGNGEGERAKITFEEARDRLLAALGTSAPAPKPPAYAPSGMTVVYRSGGSRRLSLGATRRLPAT
jgi:hypothetical protein